ncbi:MAG: hypothetical protein IPL99_24150 [Candidatus Competibacteraceae bacterium]|nr:hypothetical protein [Candidatus Competibacteraceae bacterium]
MKTPTTLICPACGSPDSTGHGHYETVHNGSRSLHACTSCGAVFSETTGTPMQDIKTPIRKVAAALRWRGEGLGLRARTGALGCPQEHHRRVGKPFFCDETHLDALRVVPNSVRHTYWVDKMMSRCSSVIG